MQISVAFIKPPYSRALVTGITPFKASCFITFDCWIKFCLPSSTSTDSHNKAQRFISLVHCFHKDWRVLQNLNTTNHTITPSSSSTVFTSRFLPGSNCMYAFARSTCFFFLHLNSSWNSFQTTRRAAPSNDRQTASNPSAVCNCLPTIHIRATLFQFDDTSSLLGQAIINHKKQTRSHAIVSILHHTHVTCIMLSSTMHYRVSSAGARKLDSLFFVCFFFVFWAQAPTPTFQSPDCELFHSLACKCLHLLHQLSLSFSYSPT